MTTTTVGPVATRERSLAPDLARGLALLGIALANSASHISGVELGPGHRPADGSSLDRVVDAVVTLLVDRRTLPVFAVLVGYGLAVVLRRQLAAGAAPARARALLLRRCLWLAVLGAAHVLLLFSGDILLAYGLTGLALVPLLHRADRTLLRWAAWLVVPGAVLAGLSAGLEGSAVEGGPESPLGPSEERVLGALAVRALGLAGYLVLSPVLVASVLPLLLLGAWAARRRLLEAPHEHLPLLRRLVVVGFALSVLGGLPHALVVARVLEPGPVVLGLFGAAHEVTGMAGGVALAALVALVVGTRLARAGAALRPRGAVRVLQAVGARSLTCYLAQSVLFVLPLAPWAGGLGADMSSTRVVLWALGVWLVTAALATALDAAGRPGPVEVLLRRLVYGRRRVRPPRDPASRTTAVPT